MPDNYDEEGGKQVFVELVRQAREQMQMARGDYYADKISGSVSLRTRQQLAQAAIQYYDVMWEYRTRNTEVKNKWEESDVDLIDELQDRQAPVEVAAAGDTAGGQTEYRNALVAADPDAVVELTKELDQIANELGFAASTKKVTPHDAPDHEDLRGLVELRGQEESAEKLPEPN